MADHFVRHLLRVGDHAITDFKCSADVGSSCRVTCILCESNGEECCVCESQEPPRDPRMGDIGYCMITAWLKEDAPEECYNGAESQEVRGPGWQPIVPEWNGDNWSWDYAP